MTKATISGHKERGVFAGLQYATTRSRLDLRKRAFAQLIVLARRHVPVQDEPDMMRALLVEPDGILRDVIDKHHGYLFKHTGDGAAAAFASA